MSTPEVGTLQADAYHAMFKKKADVLIIGSSRARHTFSPSLITDSTGLTAYNAGYDGHGMNYSLSVASHKLLSLRLARQWSPASGLTTASTM